VLKIYPNHLKVDGGERTRESKLLLSIQNEQWSFTTGARNKSPYYWTGPVGTEPGLFPQTLERQISMVLMTASNSPMQLNAGAPSGSSKLTVPPLLHGQLAKPWLEW